MSGWAPSDAASHRVPYCLASSLPVPARDDGKTMAAEATSLMVCCAGWFQVAQAFIRVSGYFEMMAWALRKEVVVFTFPFPKNCEVSRCCLTRAVLVSLECALL